ncbi:hypothetical protein E4T21_17325 [Halomonas binhaiensis]|uniref:Alpha/beta hydrolase domain-containing protein n=2 Tax=Halomonas binhaiensis TaxID=2562282 RepID=A0A5C1NP01_9GAMM|nr:hypothetical protein E4T21_17325 [Halomonas binhaiensis]
MRILAAGAMAMAGTLASQMATAKVEEFEVIDTVSPAFEGATFGNVGQYERINAIAHFAIDPDSPRGRSIVDLDQAPIDDDGLVRYSTEVIMLRPVDASRGSGVLFYDVPNRGNTLGPILMNLADNSTPPVSAADTGDGFLLKQGYTVVWSGWQTGLPDDAINLMLPQLDGVTGQSREEFIFDTPGTRDTVPLSYPVANSDPDKATLSVRLHPTEPRSTAPGLSFRYLSDSEVEITRPQGLDAGAIYEFIYPAKGAQPTGLGFTATSDLISFLRGNPGHDTETPLQGIKAAMALGISQSGRYLRDFVYQGFNADESGARVFDGVIPHIAGSRKTFTNYRFAQPGRYSRQHEDHDFPGDQFPFSYAQVTDPISGRSDSILANCTATDTCPKIMHTDTSTEFWQARAALVSTAPDGTPLALPDSVRLYYLSGLRHFAPFSENIALEQSSSEQNPDTPLCRFSQNPVSASPIMRGLLTAMKNWVTKDLTPPPSRYPSVSDNTLVDLAELNLPELPSSDFIPAYNELRLRDHGSLPPTAGPTYPVLVPQLDADGNPQGGIATPRVAVPLGTYWGWNLRNEGYAGGDLCGLAGSFIPFSQGKFAQGTSAQNTFAQGTTEGNSRTSLTKRYANQDDYARAVRDAASALTKDGYMLKEDIDLVTERALQDFQAVAP